MAVSLPVGNGWRMRIILVFICAITLLATAGCIIPVEEGGGGRGYSDHGNHGYHDDHGGHQGGDHDGDNH